MFALFIVPIFLIYHSTLKLSNNMHTYTYLTINGMCKQRNIKLCDNNTIYSHLHTEKRDEKTNCVIDTHVDEAELALNCKISSGTEEEKELQNQENMMLLFG